MPTLEEELSGKPFEYVPIKVTSGILLHIGAGIYSSVAGAIKELVSNAFDADATRVVISTGYPEFESIQVTDNGTGMSATDFRKAMASIGTSLRRALQAAKWTAKYNRPIIGMLGIGLMALTQICEEATIESTQEGEDTKFVAKLDFRQFRSRISEQRETATLEILRDRVSKQPLDDVEVDTERLARLELAQMAEERLAEEGFEDTEGEQLGYCVVYPNLPATPGDHGTTITLTALDPGVVSTLRDEGRAPDAMPQHIRNRSLTWQEFCQELRRFSWEELCERLRLRTSQLAFNALPQYHQFLWELAAMTPVEYFDRGPLLVEKDVLAEKKRELKRYRFSLLVDNQKLYKPILLPSGDVGKEESPEPELDYYLELLELDEEVDGERLRYHGYVFWQRTQVQPSALRGLQIYLRNIGIGLYDPTLLNFSIINPSLRAPQMSGEIYVEEGLERALNVDRNSFRETDAHYVELQRHIFEVIGHHGEGIIGKSVDSYYKRKRRADQQAAKVHFKELGLLVQQLSNEKLRLEVSGERSSEPCTIVGDRLVLYDEFSGWPRSGFRRQLAQRVLVAIETAIAAKATPEEIRDLIRDILF